MELEFIFQIQKQGKHCGPTASEVYPETAACAQPSVVRYSDLFHSKFI